MDDDSDLKDLMLTTLENRFSRKGVVIADLLEVLYDCIKKNWFFPKFPEGTTEDEMEKLWKRGHIEAPVVKKNTREEGYCDCGGRLVYVKEEAADVCQICGTEYATTTQAQEYQGGRLGGNIDNPTYFTRLDKKKRVVEDTPLATRLRNKLILGIHNKGQDSQKADPDVVAFRNLKEKVEPLLISIFAANGVVLPETVLVNTFLYLKYILGEIRERGGKEPGANARRAVFQRILYIVCQRNGFGFVTLRDLSYAPFQKVTLSLRNKAANLVEKISASVPGLDMLRNADAVRRSQCQNKIELDAWQEDVVGKIYEHLDYIDNKEKRRLVAVSYFLLEVRPKEGIQLLGDGLRSKRMAEIRKRCQGPNAANYLQSEIKRLKAFYARRITQRKELNAVLESPRRITPKKPKTPSPVSDFFSDVEASGSQGSDFFNDSETGGSQGSDFFSDSEVSSGGSASPPKAADDSLTHSVYLTRAATKPDRSNLGMGENMGLVGPRLSELFPVKDFRRVGSQQDGTCFFHSVRYLLSAEYRRAGELQQSKQGKAFRQIYADDSKRHYDLADLGAFAWTPKTFKKMLRDPSEYVGQEVWKIVSQEEKVNIVVLHLHTDKPVCASYSFDDSMEYLIIVYIGRGERGHFEPLVQVDSSNKIIKTRFIHTDQIIIDLKNSIRTLCT